MKLLKLHLFLIFAIVVSCTPSRNLADPTYKETSKLRNHVNFLASDSLKGRLPGTPESDIAAKYIKDQLQSYGYKPLAADGFQTFDLVISQKKLGNDNTFAIDGKPFQQGKDFTVLPISSSDEVSAKVTFVGHGLSIDQDGLKKDDYQNVNIKGKWALMLFGAPSDKYNLYSRYQSKAVVARDKGAVGVIFVAEPTDDLDNELMPFALREAGVGIPCIQVTRAIVNEYMHKESRDFPTVEKNLANDINTINYESDFVVSARTKVESIRVNTHNVVMMLEGYDPALKNESIVIGAHYDHLGFGGRGSGSRRPNELAIHNGADDNASGVSLVMRLAERLAKQKEQLKRSVVVVLFGAEEQGIVGSKYFVAHTPKEVGRIAAMLNFDMVGRLNKQRNIQISGVGTFEQGEEIVKSALNPDNLKLTLSKGGFGPSDHASFYAKQIPVLYFTTGVHMDYHTPNDLAEKLDYEGIHSIELLAKDIVKQLANLAKAPIYQHVGDSYINSGTHRKFKVTLGIIPDFTSSGSDGMRADVISEGRPAYKAGMQAGDIIISINKKPVLNVQDYMQRLSELKAGEMVEIIVKRNNEDVILQIQL
ncbi:MAG: M20/M25/M40 family metallo-hydrolase [Prevotellaceae bacterium]|jgi:hypothetical protein|nr:M20/M25/M40 family metallo-hydrolase [Prevotellaceae bacterium]